MSYKHALWLLLVLFGSVVVFQSTPAADPAQAPVTALPPPAPQTNKLLKWGVPGPAAQYSDFLVAYDARLRIPAWTLEHLTRRSYQGFGDRAKSDFKENTAIAIEFRASLEDYIGSGYDRGHMVPADAHKDTQETINSTFLLSNVAPQLPVFNRGPWRKLELYVQDMLDREDVQEVWVHTIPLFLPTDPKPQGKASQQIVAYETIGPNHVAVPTHFAKVFLVELNGQPFVWAYMLPNKVLDTRDSWAQLYRIDIDFVEHWSGLDLWSALPDDIELLLESPPQENLKIEELP